MQRGQTLLVLFLSLLLLPLAGGNALAGKWKKYDDFNKSNQIDTQKWDIRDENGTIEIENGRAKFVRIAGNPRTVHHLVFNECPENIIGIKATIEVMPDCTSTDEEVGLFFHLGTFDNYYSGVNACIDPDRNRIAGSLLVLDQDNDYTFLYDLFWSMLASNVDIVQDGPFTVSAIYDSKRVIFEVEGRGKVIYDIPRKAGDKIDHWARIGAWSNNGEGPCTFYVDDVYVMRKGKCDKKPPKVKRTIPKKNKKKISRDTKWIEITFNETMQKTHSVSTSGSWPLSADTQTEWINGKTFRISRDNPDDLLPPNSTIEVTLNPGGGGFQDLKGFPLKEYTFKFTTGN